jgi:cytochrome c oxidase assembly protein subunit 15
VSGLPDLPEVILAAMDFKDAFVLWRGLGIDYEGGVLDHPARVAIHFTHRLGALAASTVLAAVAWLAVRRRSTRASAHCRHGARRGALHTDRARTVNGAARLPLALATAHNGVAALLLLAIVAVLRSVTATAGSQPHR